MSETRTMRDVEATDGEIRGARHRRRTGPGAGLTRPGAGPTLVVDLDRAARVAVWAVLAILLLNLVPILTAQFAPDSTADKLALRFLSVHEESNVPTLLSVTLFLCSAVAAFVCRGLSRARTTRLAWGGIGVALGAAGIDEFVQVHEMGSYYLKPLVPHGAEAAIPWPWVLGGLVVVAGLVALFGPFVLRLNARVRRWLVIGAFLFLLGALGFETLGGIVTEHGIGEGHLLYEGLNTVEEGLEFLGVTAVLHGLLVQMGQLLGSRYLRLGARD